MKLNKKQWIIIGAALVAVIIAVVAIVASTGGKDEAKPETKQETQQEKVETVVYEAKDPDSDNYAVVEQTGDCYKLYGVSDQGVRALVMEFCYGERDGWRQFWGFDESGMGTMFTFKDGVAQEWMVGRMLYTKTTENGMTVYDTPQGQVAVKDGVMFQLEGDSEMYFNEVSDGYYVYSENGNLAFTEIKDEYIILGQLDHEVDGAQLEYEPGKKLMLSYQDEIIGVRVENNELVLSMYGDEIRLPRK